MVGRLGPASLFSCGLAIAIGLLAAFPAEAWAPEHAQSIPECVSCGYRHLQLSDAALARVRSMRASHPGLHEDAFSKMGGSSVESRAFLYCLASEFVEFGDHGELSDTVEFFDPPGRSSFARKSLAAGVSWNLRYVLAGRPPRFRREIDETRARYALVLFGANDAQYKNERVYARRLVELIDRLVDLGVVPVLGAAPPRRSPTDDRWVRRHNLITEAIAKHWELPYVDYYTAMSELPRKGLARDGLHPNVFPPGGTRAACRFGERGLRYGHNLRNLLTLQMLEALRNAADAPPPSREPAFAGPPTPWAESTPATVTVDDLPFSARVDKAALEPSDALPPGCGEMRPGSRVYRTRVALEERARIRAIALDLDGYRPRVFWVQGEAGNERCLKRRTQVLQLAARPGLWDLVVEVPERASNQGEMLVLIALNR